MDAIIMYVDGNAKNDGIRCRRYYCDGWVDGKVVGENGAVSGFRTIFRTPGFAESVVGVESQKER